MLESLLRQLELAMVCKTQEKSVGQGKRARVLGRRERGSALLMSLMYVTLFGALAASMVSFTSATLEVAAGSDRSTRAFAAAESGMSFLMLQLKQIPKPITASGSISQSLARTLYSGSGGLQEKIAAQLNGTTNLQGRLVLSSATTVQIPPIKMFSSIDDTCFALQIVQDATDARILHLTSTGRCTGVMKSVSMDITIDKKLKYAIYSNVAIQIGKNAVVEGDIVSTLTGFQKGPPVWMLSDFRALSNMSTLDSRLVQFRSFLPTEDPTYSNKIDLNSSTLSAADKNTLFNLKAVSRVDTGLRDASNNPIYNYTARSGDRFVSEWDLALGALDTNANKAISTGEFTDPNTGVSYDGELFSLIDSLSPPLTTGGTPRAGYKDGTLDARDNYSKVKGTVQVGVTQAAWDAWSRDTGSGGGSSYGVGFREQFQGPVTSPDPTVPPVQFAIDQTDVPVILPSAFDTSSYASQAGPAAGTTSGSVATGTIQNATITAAMANGGTLTEGTPFGSTTIQATYKRPVFKNVTFKNVKIPKGLNALFQNCTFQGVTYVDMQTNITNSGGATSTDPNDGMTWSKKMVGAATFSSTTTLTASNSYGFQEGNNLRFDNCAFNGPIAAANPSAYSHFTNSWEFTGSTLFNNTVDPTATILAPNTNIEMGSFTDVNANPSTLVGVVVAGNIDIRGSSLIDGSIIVTGNGATNTTLAYFGSSDGSSNPTAMPTGGYGKLYMRYNPTRAMPNGISIPISLIANTSSYTQLSSAYWPW